MPKNMYQKREERKNKPIEEKDNSAKINWGIRTYRQQSLNHYKY